MIARALAAATLIAVAGCSGSGTSAPPSGTLGTPAGSSSTPSPPPPSPRDSTVASGPGTSAPAPVTAALPRAGRQPVIVVDPGHSRTVAATDPRTGLDVSDYENEPEMRDVFAVAMLVRSKLVAAGYRVVLTKTQVGQRVSLGRRAAIADAAHADLALSIHDQAGPNGGIGFRSGNNVVYYQSVGTYRATPTGKKVYFTDSRVAALSRKYGRIFRAQRQRVEGSSVALQGDVGYNLGSRGLAAGDIWLVQLLSHVPWIYNESGGNSAGRSGLDAADKQTYADALVAGVEHCIPPP